MGHMSQLPASAVRTLRPQIAKNSLQRAAAALGPVVATPIAAAPAPVPAEVQPPELRELNIIGPRKLIRPTLPARSLRNRRLERRDDPMPIWRTQSLSSAAGQDSSHAESFYFQKQMQAQTPMVFVLEDGDRIEGCIEWYDRYAIKIRCSSPASRGNSIRPAEVSGGTRMLIYKSSIKYLYKAGENQP